MDTIDRFYRMFPVYRYQNSVKEIDRPFAEIQDIQENPHYVNQLQIINDGVASLEKRLQLIENAEQTLEVEYFIFSPEESSTQVLLKALMEKADEGVQVKILVDKTGASQFNEYYVEAIKNRLIKPSNFQNDKIFVGTFNMDNRSSFYNTEMGIFCEGNQNLANDVRESIEKRAIDNGLLITGNEKAVDANGNDADPLGPATKKQRALLKGTKDILEILQFII